MRTSNINYCYPVPPGIYIHIEDDEELTYDEYIYDSHGDVFVFNLDFIKKLPGKHKK